MKKKTLYKTTNDDILRIIDRIIENVDKLGIERREKLRVTLMLEEILLKYQENFGDSISVQLNESINKMSYSFALIICSNPLNPFGNDEEENETIRNLMRGQGLLLNWNYRKGENILTYRFRKVIQSKFFLEVFIAVALAVLLGFLCTLLPENIETVICDGLVTPIYNVMMRFIGFVSIPLVFLSVMWGIFSIGDIATLSSVGKKMFKTFGSWLMVFLASTMLVTFPFYPLASSARTGFSGKEVFNLLLDIVPKNLVDSFLTGNTLQIIFIAIVFGIAMLVLSEKTTVLSQFVEQAFLVVQLVMEKVSTLMPIIIFLSLFKIISSGESSAFGKSALLYISTVLACVLIILISMIFTSVKFKLSIITIAKKIASTAMIAFTTASSGAAFSDNVYTCENRLGINKKLTAFGVPLGQTLYKPASIAVFYTVMVFIAHVYNRPISLTWLLMLAIITMIVGVAAPPIPGGAIACVSLILSQMGLPAEALGLSCTVCVLLDFPSTAANILSLQLNLLSVANELGQLNKDILYKEK